MRAQIEAMLFEPVFAPVLDSLGSYGGIISPEFTQALSRVLEQSSNEQR